MVRRYGPDMPELPLSERDLPSFDEVVIETQPFVERDLIAYHPIPDAAYGSKETLYLVDSEVRQDAAAAIARYFHRETPYDFQPYSAGDEGLDCPVHLLRTLRLSTMVPIAAGAVGMRRIGTVWCLKWVWIHPWDRGDEYSLAKHVFDQVDDLYGEFKIEAPASRAMRGLMRKRGYSLDRLVSVG